MCNWVTASAPPQSDKIAQKQSPSVIGRAIVFILPPRRFAAGRGGQANAVPCLFAQS